MSDITEDDGFSEEAFKALEDASNTPVATDEPPATPPATPPAEPPKEDPKKDDNKPEGKEDNKTPEAGGDSKEDKKPEDSGEPEKKPEAGDKPPETPEAPGEPQESAPQPLTKDDVKTVISDFRNEERASSKELETATQDVLAAYYPEGLSNVLVDESTNKELRTPADVVEAARAQGDEMSMEQAAQWLMNEQFKMDNKIKEIKNNAEKIAQTTLKFDHDGRAVIQKYKPMFDALKEKYPNLQEKVFQKLMNQVKVDKEKKVILSSPDVQEWYDDYLAPYWEAYEQIKGSTVTPPAAPETPPEPPKPSTEDRLDEGGDGGATTEVDDPNDFAQQVAKELAK